MSGGWNTIESDAGVFTFLLDNLGVKGVQFEELIALDSSYLAELSPVYGVIFLFKYPTGAQASSFAASRDGTFDEAAGQDIFFAAQTIQNACGTQALLSVLLNQADNPEQADGGVGNNHIELGDALRDFKDFTIQLPPEFRGEALSNSELIREVHNSFARSSPFVDETQRGPAEESDDVYHFIAYTPVNGVLYELDGLQQAPISHGACTAAEFPEKVIPVLQRRIERYPAGEIRFNLLAMIGDLRAKARAIGDDEMLLREEQKRDAWRFENALRRHNFVGFAGEILKNVIREKLKKGEYEKWIEDAKKATQRRLEEQQGRRKGVDEDTVMG